MAMVGTKNKLTLWLDRDVIAVGKAEAKRQHKSLSEMFRDFVQGLNHSSPYPKELSARVKRLKGSLRSKTVGIEDYYRHLERKHLTRG